MFKVLRYLKKSKAAVAAIIALLILQAYCDLALPQFTADIVDVGIGQGGIENAVPKRMRGETMEELADEGGRSAASFQLPAVGGRFL